jgi:geranylgeranyl pyrophosphate synthase
MDELKSFFDASAAAAEETMRTVVAEAAIAPPRLREAVEWSLFGGGKRFRPALMLAVGEAFGVERRRLLRPAAAVEMIHTYSLIHDDLPAMDDDDLRRGRPTCHKKFDEATAILAGDALQVLAFKTIADDEQIGDRIRVEMVAGLAAAAVRMVAGQQLDLDSEGKAGGPELVQAIHRDKTGALIVFSAEAALAVGEVDVDERRPIIQFAELLGLMFQIRDDLLDVTETTETLGKTAAKDESVQKLTYPGVFGLERSREILDEIHAEAGELLGGVGRDTARLKEIADFIVHRRS